MVTKVETTQVKIVDVAASLTKLGYVPSTAPAMASKFVKKMYKTIGEEKSGRYLPEDLWNGLRKIMVEAKSKYDWDMKKSAAATTFIESVDIPEKVESRASLLREELNAFYKALPKTMPVEALTLALSALLGDLEESYPDPVKAEIKEEETD